MVRKKVQKEQRRRNRKVLERTEASPRQKSTVKTDEISLKC